MNNIHNKPSEASFSRRGADGYSFKTANKKIEIDFINSKTGHGGAVVAENITHFYYILRGNGVFVINDLKYEVGAGQLVEIPPKSPFNYSGRMEMLLVMEPPFSPNEIRDVK